MKLRTLARLSVLFLLVPLILAGCGAAGSTTKSTTASQPKIKPPAAPQPVEKDWVLYTRDDAGFALSLPAYWKKFDLDKEALNQIMSEMSTANPQLASALSDQIASMASQGIKFYAYDQFPPSLSRG